MKLDANIVCAVGLEATKEADLVHRWHVLLNVVEDKEIDHLLFLFSISLAEFVVEFIQKAMCINLLERCWLDLSITRGEALKDSLLCLQGVLFLLKRT